MSFDTMYVMVEGGGKMKKTAIITGASSGIGQAIAEKLASEGVNVVLAARRAERLVMLAEQMNVEGNAEVIAVPTDVTNPDDVEALFAKAIVHFGSVDLYVNNAGQMLSGAVTDGKLDDWEQMVDVNIKGVLYGLHHAVPHMITEQSGHIVNISSVSGQEVTTKSTVYSATKFAVRAISMGLEKELARTGVRVTNISPGMVDTDLLCFETDRKPLEPEDIANTVWYAFTQPDWVNVNEITIRPV